MSTRVKKNSTGQLNPEKEVAISGGFGSIIWDPQISIEPKVNPQRGEEEAQTDTKKRKASSSLDLDEGTVHEVNIPKFFEFARRDGVQTPIILVESPKDDDDV
ncbi:hypothetical protein ACH5RR_009631 [Cinchona calisaya]|uniref:Uncharacterized protein n=1 Tax=Cinchona calisaya TaxID=153742 RepID=A0ABD3AEX9_9GENT